MQDHGSRRCNEAARAAGAHLAVARKVAVDEGRGVAHFALPPCHQGVRATDDVVEGLHALGVDVRVHAAVAEDDEIAEEVRPLHILGQA